MEHNDGHVYDNGTIKEDDDDDDGNGNKSGHDQEQEKDKENDWENSPAMHYANREEAAVDNHEMIQLLNSLGVHRTMVVNCWDGRVISPMTGLVDLPLPSLDCGRDIPIDAPSASAGQSSTQQNALEKIPLYILYTSGSTSINRPKAVVQTHGGLINRISWQWKTFPFVQQLRRTLGLKPTLKLLASDGIYDEDWNDDSHNSSNYI